MRHGIGKWTLNYDQSNKCVKNQFKKIGKKIILLENFTGWFQNNHFEGYGIYITKYKILNEKEI